MFQVPKRTTTANCWHRREVVIRGRRTRGPFERPRVPRIIASQFTLLYGADNVDGEHQNGGRLTERSHRSDEIERVPATPSVVSEDASRHPEQAREVLCIERQMEPDDEQPEVPEFESTIVEAAHRFRIPVIKAGKDAEEKCTDERVVKVC